MKFRLLLLVIAVGLIAAATAVAATRSTPPLRYVGVVENKGLYDFPDPNQPSSTARRVREVGFNSQRINLQWDPANPAPSQDQLRWVCNVAVNAAAYQIPNLILTLAPPPDAYPVSDEGRENYRLALHSYVAKLFDRGTGCVGPNSGHPLSGLMILPLNEPNLEGYCRPQTEEDHVHCAEATVQLMAKLYPAIKADAQQYQVSLNVICGGLSSHHDPISYMRAETKARAKYGITASNCDMFGFHPYFLPSDNNTSSPLSGMLMYPNLVKAIKAEYGRALPVIYDEFGIEAHSPQGKGYTCESAKGGRMVPEVNQAYIYQVALSLARKQGVLGLFFFLLDDEQCLGSGWQSGLYYWDGTPKPFLPSVEKAVQKALSP